MIILAIHCIFFFSCSRKETKCRRCTWCY